LTTLIHDLLRGRPLRNYGQEGSWYCDAPIRVLAKRAVPLLLAIAAPCVIPFHLVRVRGSPTNVGNGFFTARNVLDGVRGGLYLQLPLCSQKDIAPDRLDFRPCRVLDVFPSERPGFCEMEFAGGVRVRKSESRAFLRAGVAGFKDR